MMKHYHIYVFTQDNCPPCARLKEHVSGLTEAQQAELDFVPLRAADGNYTCLAEDLKVDKTPTLVVVDEEVQCRLEEDGFEDCDYYEEPVERFVGANNIIEHLDATIDAYTYANPD